MGLDRRGTVIRPLLQAQPEGRRREAGAKTYEIAKREVWQAYKRVKANGGAAGADGVTLEQYEQDLQGKARCKSARICGCSRAEAEHRGDAGALHFCVA